VLKLLNKPVYLLDNQQLVEGSSLVEVNDQLTAANLPSLEDEDFKGAYTGTMTYRILKEHNHSGCDKDLRLKFDGLTSHDITYVGIIQTAIASGLKEFPMPYILTNCHNSLSAVGGTINQDDHVFGLSAAKKFGGIFVPAHLAVIHSYMREMYAGCGKMLMGSDSHTRYGALGTMAVGEGGPEIAKQLLSRTYDIAYPDVVGVYLTGAPKHGVGPQDVALAMIKAVFENEFVKNAAMEFVGPGVDALSVDFRNGIDVMTTETTCWSTIWKTDEKVKSYLKMHGREADYQELRPAALAKYDRMIVLDLSEIKPMIALPFHPSNGYTIEEFSANAKEILHLTEEKAKAALENQGLTLGLLDKLDSQGRFIVDQGVIAGCSGGTYENILEASRILKGASIGAGGFDLSVYAGSQPIQLDLMRKQALEELMLAGATIRTAFCGPCFGAGDTPGNQGLSIRHTTRNFPNREGSKPGEGQLASVALMDSRSIAATAKNQGVLTAADQIEYEPSLVEFHFDGDIYEKRVYQGFGKAVPAEELVFGPNIAAWPEMSALGEDLLLEVASVIHDPVTTTDELMPSGETSSLRSNPIRLSQFTLSRKDPNYLGRTQRVKNWEDERLKGLQEGGALYTLAEAMGEIGEAVQENLARTQLGTVVVSIRPGDGSAREQAASGQKVLGGLANVAVEYATKRYRNNLINWGMLPLQLPEEVLQKIEVGQYIYIPGIRQMIEERKKEIPGYLVRGGAEREEVMFTVGDLNEEECEILLAGSLINYYKGGLV
jgi:Aconitase A